MVQCSWIFIHFQKGINRCWKDPHQALLWCKFCSESGTLFSEDCLSFIYREEIVLIPWRMNINITDHDRNCFEDLASCYPLFIAFLSYYLVIENLKVSCFRLDQWLALSTCTLLRFKFKKSIPCQQKKHIFPYNNA